MEEDLPPIRNLAPLLQRVGAWNLYDLSMVGVRRHHVDGRQIVEVALTVPADIGPEPADAPRSATDFVLRFSGVTSIDAFQDAVADDIAAYECRRATGDHPSGSEITFWLETHLQGRILSLRARDCELVSAA